MKIIEAQKLFPSCLDCHKEEVKRKHILLLNTEFTVQSKQAECWELIQGVLGIRKKKKNTLFSCGYVMTDELYV
jgi:hypothetical protein